MRFNLILSLILFSTSVFSQNISLEGKWENKKYSVSYEFRKDSSLIFTQHSSSSFISSYTVDFTKEPGWIDFTITLGSNSMIIPGLIKTIDNNTIIIEQFTPSSVHPVKFTEESNSSVITKHELNRKIE